MKTRCEGDLQTKSEVSIAIYNRFKEPGIEIPFPQRDVHIKEVPANNKGIGEVTG